MYSNKLLRYVVAMVLGLAAHAAGAQPVNGCPAGQAMQSSDASGRSVTCVPIPNIGALQGQISSEAAARTAADTQLQNRLNDETAARLVTEAVLRASIGGAETSIVGKYTFTGTQVCLNSPQGFDPVTFLPLLQPAPPQPAPIPPMFPPTVLGPGTFVNPSTATVSGFRTFNADGTGTAEVFTHSLGHPGVFYANGINSNGQPFISTGVSAGMGSASTAHLTGSFTWHIAGGKLTIDEGGVVFEGPITSGGTRLGWIVSTENPAPLVGVVGKDLRIISMVQEVAAIEIGVLTSPAGQPFQQFRTPRTCHRERTLRRIEG
jgi:hypothetical protein